MSALARLVAALAEVAGPLEQAVLGFERGDAEDGRAALDRSRTARARLVRVKAQPIPQAALAGPEAALQVADARVLSQAIGALDARLDRALVARPLDEQGVVDRLLPRMWNFDADLAVVTGDAYAPVVGALSRRGVRRVIWLGDGAPPGAVPAANREELTAACAFPSPPPERIQLFAAPGAPARVPELAKVLEEAVSRGILSGNTTATFGRQCATQAVRNLPRVARATPVAAVGDALRGLPMVVVSPGPSLAKNVALLKELEGRAIRVVVSHALHPVMAAGVTPELVLTVDPQDLRNHFAGLDLSGLAGVVLPASAWPDLHRLPVRRTLSFLASADERWVGEVTGAEEVLPSGGSVAHCAASLGLLWGCDPIIFIGQDLAFADGKLYVDTSIDAGATAELAADGRTLSFVGYSTGTRALIGGAERTRAERVLTLPGWAGGTVQTSYSFSIFARWFEELVAAHPGTRFLNCTEGGVHIAGMDHRPLAEVIPALTARVALEPVLAALPSPPDREIRAAGAARERAVRAEEALRLARRCARRSAAGQDAREAEAALNAAVARLPELQLALQGELRRAMSDARELRSDADARRAAHRLHQAAVDAAAALVEAHRAAREAP